MFVCRSAIFVKIFPLKQPGTSLGGIIGMVLASASNCPISRFFMVDIGPFCPKESLKELRHVVDVPLLKVFAFEWLALE